MYSKIGFYSIRGQNNGQGGRLMSRRGENIRKRKDGRWEGRYQVTDINTGIKHTHSIYARTYSETKEKLTAVKADMSNQSQTPNIPGSTDKTITVDYAACQWLLSVKSKRKISTYVKYQNTYTMYIKPIIGNQYICNIKQESFDALFRDETGKSESINKSITCITNQILKYGAEKFNIPVNSIARTRTKHINKPIETMSRSEQMKLVNYLITEPDIYKTGIILCLSTGLRLGEICSLKWSDIDFDNNILHVRRTVQRIAVSGQPSKTVLWEGEPKSCFSKRDIPLADNIASLLLKFRHDGDYVLKDNSPMEPRTYQNKYTKYLEASHIKRSNFHILRHTFATNCIENGVDIKSLSEILGHSDVRITLNRYVHPTMETKRQHMNSLAVIYGQYAGQQCV